MVQLEKSISEDYHNMKDDDTEIVLDIEDTKLLPSATEYKDCIIWLVAEVVRSEKLRKHKAYEDFVNHEDQNGEGY